MSQDEKLQSDEKLVNFIRSTTTALLATKISRGIVRLLLKTYLAQLKVYEHINILHL